MNVMMHPPVVCTSPGKMWYSTVLHTRHVSAAATTVLLRKHVGCLHSDTAFAKRIMLDST
jgi:hypothetical protein